MGHTTTVQGQKTNDGEWEEFHAKREEGFIRAGPPLVRGSVLALPAFALAFRLPLRRILFFRASGDGK